MPRLALRRHSPCYYQGLDHENASHPPCSENISASGHFSLSLPHLPSLHTNPVDTPNSSLVSCQPSGKVERQESCRFQNTIFIPFEYVLFKHMATMIYSIRPTPPLFLLVKYCLPSSPRFSDSHSCILCLINLACSVFIFWSHNPSSSKSFPASISSSNKRSAIKLPDTSEANGWDLLNFSTHSWLAFEHG